MGFLELSGLRKTYQHHAVVENFNLSVQRGEFISFLGPSGCGKTTTLRMVAGFETPTAGTIHIDGQDVGPLAPNQRRIGMVFQSYALFPNLSIADNVAFGLKVAGRPRAEIDAHFARRKAERLAREREEMGPVNLRAEEDAREIAAEVGRRALEGGGFDSRKWCCRKDR